MKIPLARARAYAEQIVEQIRPFCERVEIAGSIRRQRPVVNDIDLVAIPKDWIALQRRCLEKCTAITRGDFAFSFETKSGVQIDLFTAHAGFKDLLTNYPSNWGSKLLQRTGSTEHNIFLVERAKALGLRWEMSKGILNEYGTVVASESEEDMFKALGLEFVPPDARER
jgi:DNA polymerase (family 10)